MSQVSVVGATRFLRTSLFQYARTWRGSVFSGFVGPVLYLGAIGFGLGSLVDADGAAMGTVGGEPVDYVAFLAPGLIAATALQVAAGDAIFGTMAGVKWQRTWHTATAAPLEPGDVALGHLAFCGARGALAALSYALVTAAFGVLPLGRALMTVLPATLGALALSAVMMGLMVRSASESMMNAAQRFVVLPMFLFSGVFFPVDQLPDWIQPVARATPLWHAVRLARGFALGEVTPSGGVAPAPSAGPGLLHVAVLVTYVVVGVLVALRNFPRTLRT